MRIWKVAIFATSLIAARALAPIEFGFYLAGALGDHDHRGRLLRRGGR
jgi:hypothetical protein